MNRSTMFEIMQESGMYGPIMVRYSKRDLRDSKDFYTRKFVLDMEKGQYNCTVTTDWGAITNVESIHLTSREVIIEGRLTDMTVIIDYKDIKEFVVEFEEE